MVSARGRIRPAAARRTRFTARGWVFLVAAALLVFFAYLLRRPELLFIGAFVAAVVLLAFALISFQRPKLDVRRTFSPLVITAGRVVTVSLAIHNLSAHPLAATNWRDECGWAPQNGVVGSLGALRSGVLRNREPRASARVSYDLVPPRRGIFEIGPFSITLTDPFGLAAGTQLAHRAQSVTVVPEVTMLPETGLAIAEADGSSRLVQHRVVGGDHDITTRAYRTGDALRRVHWRASAHHGDLMVRQEEQRSHSEASILLDTRVSGYADLHTKHLADHAESEAFEWAVGFTASLVQHLQHSGFVVHMYETAASQLASVEQATVFLESLATVSLSAESEPISTVLAVSAQGSGRTPGSMFAILSDADDELVHSLAAGRSAFEMAIAFVIMPSDDRVYEPLRSAGWICVTVRAGDSAESAWLSVVDRAGERHGVR